MKTERVIKIFMASSDELEGDRAVFGNLIRHLNDLYRKRGIYIELFQWEDFDASYGSIRKQEEYNEKVRDSDLFLAFFHKKAGEFTIEEFNVALDHFEKSSQPKIYTYMKDLVDGEEEEENLTAFKGRLYRDMGHYWCRYGNTDTMKLHFVMQFQLQEENKNETHLELKDSKVFIDNHPVANLQNIPFAANNDAYKDMVSRKTKLEEKVTRYRARIAKDPDDSDSLADLSETLTELKELSEKLEQHEQFLFDIAKMFARQAGNACSERMLKARELFEQGKANEANGILNTEDINRDITANLHRWERDKERVEEDLKVLQGNIEELLLKTKTSMGDDSLSINERFEQACNAYDKAIELQRKLDVLPEELARSLFAYAYLLYDFKKFNSVLPLYTESLSIFRELSKTNPDIYLPDVARILNNLALLHKDLNKYSLAEAEYTESLSIKRELAQMNPDVYLPDVALTLNNLAILHKALNKYSLAEEEYTESLSITRELAQTSPNVYLPDVADTLHNLALLHKALNKYSLAEEKYIESLGILEKMYLKSPHYFGKDLFHTILSYGKMLYDKNLDISKGKLLIQRAYQMAKKHADQPWSKAYLKSTDGLLDGLL